MKPTAPLNLPSALQPRLDRIMQRLAQLPFELPPEIATTAVRVAMASDFALSVLMRYPQELVERLEDRSALTIDALAARLTLDTLTEA
ncbi:MAG TPA: hypothetical protein VJA26_00415, partial [Gammaproteobacteria bacterium]|nr:hypothetical protein [Gammaproteobacteria bacterium]